MKNQPWKYELFIGGFLVAILGLVLFMVPKADASMLVPRYSSFVSTSSLEVTYNGSRVSDWGASTSIDYTGNAFASIYIVTSSAVTGGLDVGVLGYILCEDAAGTDCSNATGWSTNGSTLNTNTSDTGIAGNFVNQKVVFRFPLDITTADFPWGAIYYNSKIRTYAESRGQGNPVILDGCIATTLAEAWNCTADGTAFEFDYPGDEGVIYNSTHFTIAFPDEGLIPLATSTAFFGASFSLSSSSILEPPSLSDNGISGEEEPGVISSRVNCFLNTGNEFCVSRTTSTSSGFPGVPVYKARFPFDPWEYVGQNSSTVIYARPWYRYKVGNSWTYRTGPSISFTIKSGGTNANSQDAYHVWVGERATTYDDSSFVCTPAEDWTDIGGGIRYGGCSLGQFFLTPDPLFTNKIESQFNDLQQMFPFSIASALKSSVESSSLAVVGNNDIVLTVLGGSYPIITSSTMPDLLGDDSWYWTATENIIHVVAFLTLFALVL